jgi:predicted DNA-binding transcriptional regulator AlpA
LIGDIVGLYVRGELLTRIELAKILKVSTKWIDRRMKAGTLPFDRIRLSAGILRFDSAAVDDYLRQNSIAAGTDYEVNRFLAKKHKKEVAK